MTFDESASVHRRFELPGSAPHYGPDKTVEVEHIHLHLIPDLEAHALDGECTTTIRALDEDVAELALDAVDLQVSATSRSGGGSTAFTRRGNKIAVHFDPPVRAGETAQFTIVYRLERPRHGLFFVEPTALYPDKVRHAWTQSQDENARYWFPCLDYPAEKQTTSTTVVVKKGLFALANGVLTQREDRGETTVFTYEQRVAHSTYLTTLVVGPFVEIEQRGGEVPVYYYVLPGRQADGERSFGKTPKMIDVFEKAIGTKYPYGRYSQIAVSDFIFGGMENTSATTQTDRTLHDERAHLDFSSDPLVSHELAHQWFGDLLTCRDWSHAWLNEGFATYFEAVFREADLGYDEYLYDIFGCVERYLDEDAGRYRRPIVCNTYRDPIELFDRHLYEKGGAVLHMLRGDLGEKRFWRAIARYVRDNAGRNVETIDLIRAIEVSSGRNMRGFFDQWVYRGGHPEVTVDVAYDSKRKMLKVTIAQKQHADERNPLHTFTVEVGVCERLPNAPAQDFGIAQLPGERRIAMKVERAVETFFVPLDYEPKLVRFDPGAFLLGAITYKLGTDYAAATLGHDPDVVARIRAARELAKDGSPAAQAALRTAFEREPFWGVLAESAAAAGATRAPWALDLLTLYIGHAHPKVRRSVVMALGNFRDKRAAESLLPPAQNDRSYFVQAAALQALGKTRDPRAFDVLSAALRMASWNGVIESGAAHGLAELADVRVLPLLIEAAQPGKEEALRRAALGSLARLGALVEECRTSVADTINAYLADSNFLVAVSAIAAAERLGDRRSLAALDRLHNAFDGRIRRDAMEAATRIREGQKVPAQVAGLRTDIDALRDDQRKLEAKIAELGARP
ncbi:MAG: HEAT repeat domain-containing protein [Candidatus Eremiobacteraeota bacterium]|nr:HEAT repeat domain-containing protein [Candidatus Eremiobacteraeota bacterium]